jgi:hypothetical protein
MYENINNVKSTEGIAEFEKQFSKPDCVLLDSEYSSMGRMIGNKACKAAGYTYYDAVFLLDLVPETGVTMEEVRTFEQKLRKNDITREEIISEPGYDRITKAFDLAIDRALAKGPCLIHDRATKEMIEARGYSCVTVLTYATDIHAKIIRAKVSPLYAGMENDEDVIAAMREEDNIRKNYHKAHSDTVWGDKDTYDLCINSETAGRDYTAELIAHVMKAD